MTMSISSKKELSDAIEVNSNAVVGGTGEGRIGIETNESNLSPHMPLHSTLENDGANDDDDDDNAQFKKGIMDNEKHRNEKNEKGNENDDGDYNGSKKNDRMDKNNRNGGDDGDGGNDRNYQDDKHDDHDRQEEWDHRNTTPVKVYLRIRPMNRRELSRRSHRCVEIDKVCRENVVVNIDSPLEGEYEFALDDAFDEETSQSDFYNGLCLSNMIDKFLVGYNCAIISHGSAGSGKTWTMMGDGVGAHDSGSSSSRISLLANKERTSRMNVANSTIDSNSNRGDNVMNEINDNKNEVSKERDDKDKSNANINKGGCEGVIPRIIKDLFHRLNDVPPNIEFTVRCSFMEIYLEKVFDLLNPGRSSPKLVVPAVSDVFGGSKPRVRMDGLSEACCIDSSDALALLTRGNAQRSVTEIGRSWRGHAIFTLRLEQRDVLTGRVATSEFYMVDSAPMLTESTLLSSLHSINSINGSSTSSQHHPSHNIVPSISSGVVDSESCGIKSLPSGKAKTNSREINLVKRSLSALDEVVRCLAQRRQYHQSRKLDATGTNSKDYANVPYDQSKFTLFLREAFGGNCITSVIVTSSFASHNVSDTISTLRFAHRCRHVRNIPSLHLTPTQAEMVKQLNESERKRIGLVGILQRFTEERMQIGLIGKGGNDAVDGSNLGTGTNTNGKIQKDTLTDMNAIIQSLNGDDLQGKKKPIDDHDSFLKDEQKILAVSGYDVSNRSIQHLNRHYNYSSNPQPYKSTIEDNGSKHHYHQYPNSRGESMLSTSSTATSSSSPNAKMTHSENDVRLRDEKLILLQKELANAIDARDSSDAMLLEMQDEAIFLRSQSESLVNGRKKNTEILADLQNEIRVVSQRKVQAEHNLRTSRFREKEAAVFMRQFRRFYRRLLRQKEAAGSGSIPDILGQIPGAPDLSDLIDVDTLLVESGLIEEHEMYDDSSSIGTWPSKEAQLRSTSSAARSISFKSIGGGAIGINEIPLSRVNENEPMYESETESDSIHSSGLPYNLGGAIEACSISEIGEESLKPQSPSSLLMAANDIGSIGVRRSDNDNKIISDDENSSFTSSSFEHKGLIGRQYAIVSTPDDQCHNSPSGRLTKKQHEIVETDLLRISKRLVELQISLKEREDHIYLLENKNNNIRRQQLAEATMSMKKALEKKTHDLSAVVWKMNEIDAINKIYKEKLSNKEQHVTFLKESLNNLQIENRLSVSRQRVSEKKLTEKIEYLKSLVEAMTVPLWQFGDIKGKQSIENRIVVPIRGRGVLLHEKEWKESKNTQIKNVKFGENPSGKRKIKDSDALGTQLDKPQSFIITEENKTISNPTKDNGNKSSEEKILSAVIEMTDADLDTAHGSTLGKRIPIKTHTLYEANLGSVDDNNEKKVITISTTSGNEIASTDVSNHDSVVSVSSVCSTPIILLAPEQQPNSLISTAVETNNNYSSVFDRPEIRDTLTHSIANNDEGRASSPYVNIQSEFEQNLCMDKQSFIDMEVQTDSVTCVEVGTMTECVSTQSRISFFEKKAIEKESFMDSQLQTKILVKPNHPQTRDAGTQSFPTTIKEEKEVSTQTEYKVETHNAIIQTEKIIIQHRDKKIMIKAKHFKSNCKLESSETLGTTNVHLSTCGRALDIDQSIVIPPSIFIGGKPSSFSPRRFTKKYGSMIRSGVLKETKKHYNTKGNVMSLGSISTTTSEPQQRVSSSWK